MVNDVVENMLKNARPLKTNLHHNTTSVKLSHATCLQLELYCVNQAHDSPTLSWASSALDFHSATHFVSMHVACDSFRQKLV